MIRKLFLAILFMTSTTLIHAQDEVVKELKAQAEKEIKKEEKDTISQVWKKGGAFMLNVNQGSLSNWSAGGDKFSFSLNAFLNLYAFYKKGKNSWDNKIDLTYGIVQTTSLGLRKSSDRIDYTSKYGYGLNKNFNLSTLFNMRSQFANGFSYSKTPSGKDSAIRTSRALSPTYLLLSLGVDYKPRSNFSLFLSPITSRWILVQDTTIGHLYGLNRGEKIRIDPGAFMSVNYTAKIGKNFTYKTKLDMFSNYSKNPQNIDIFWTNAITATIAKYINFSFNLDMIYDDDIANVEPGKGPAPQLLQLMGIGFTYKFANNKK
jgi:hypothetical protein